MQRYQNKQVRTAGSACALGWEIGGCIVAIQCDDADLSPAWCSLFPSFVTPEAVARSPDVLLQVEPVSGWVNPRLVGAPSPVWSTTWTGEELLLEGPDLHGVVRSDGGRLRGELTADGDNPWILAFALRGVLHQALAGRGLLLHASGVVRGDRLYLFAGRGAVGKTTIATELNGGGTPFSVDRVVLTRAGGVLRAHPTPFSDLLGAVPRCEPGTPKALIFVEQGPRHTLKPLTPALAACQLVQHSMSTSNDFSDVASPLAVAAWMAERIPAYRMTFVKDEGFWALLDEAAGCV